MGQMESMGGSSSPVMEQALDAISEFIRSIPNCNGDMVQRFVLVVETIDEDDRWLSCFTAPGQKAWDTLGLVEFARDMERSYNQVAPPEGHDDDEEGV